MRFLLFVARNIYEHIFPHFYFQVIALLLDVMLSTPFQDNLISLSLQFLIIFLISYWGIHQCWRILSLLFLTLIVWLCQPRSLSYWWNFCCRNWFREVFSCVWDTPFFLHFHLFDGVHFQYSPVLESFTFSKHSDYFFIWHFYSFGYLCFSVCHYKYGTFSDDRFHFYVKIEFAYCLNLTL